MSFREKLGKIKCKESEHNITKKRFWNDLDKITDYNSVIKQILKVAQEDEYKDNRKGGFIFRDEGTALAFSVVSKKNNESEDFSIWRNEEAIERVLATKFDELKNQFKLGRSKENIDLVRVNDKVIEEIIELKAENGGDSPLYALAEVLKNFFILKNNLKESSDIKLSPTPTLTILAPETYYDNYLKSKEKFQELVKQMQEHEALSGIKICIKTVSIDSKAILEVLMQNKDHLILKVEDPKTKQYDKRYSCSKELTETIAKEIGEIKVV